MSPGKYTDSLAEKSRYIAPDNNTNPDPLKRQTSLDMDTHNPFDDMGSNTAHASRSRRTLKVIDDVKPEKDEKQNERREDAEDDDDDDDLLEESFAVDDNSSGNVGPFLSRQMMGYASDGDESDEEGNHGEKEVARHTSAEPVSPTQG